MIMKQAEPPSRGSRRRRAAREKNAQKNPWAGRWPSCPDRAHASTSKGHRPFLVANDRFLGFWFAWTAAAWIEAPHVHRSIDPMRTTTPAQPPSGRQAALARSIDASPARTTHTTNNAHLASTRPRFTSAPIHQHHIDRQAHGQRSLDGGVVDPAAPAPVAVSSPHASLAPRPD